MFGQPGKSGKSIHNAVARGVARSTRRARNKDPVQVPVGVPYLSTALLPVPLKARGPSKYGAFHLNACMSGEREGFGNAYF
jgi:hypothetical protein